MEKRKKSSGGIKIKAQRAKTKLLSAYFGSPARGLKLICITGSTGKTTVAHYVHEILRADDRKVAILASDNTFGAATLHKFFNEAWKAKAEYVIFTAPAESINKQVFHKLPLHVAALTDFVPSDLESPKIEEYLAAESTIFSMNPRIVVLNQDDLHYQDIAKFVGIDDTLTYGRSQDATVRIDNSKVYGKGTEANLILGNKNFTTATFLTGEPMISYMAAAAAIATALGIPTQEISEGIANYDPEEQN